MFINLKSKIDLFVDYAYKQYYFAPNNYIPKKERPKWRFKVKAYIKDLQSVPYEGIEGGIATKLLLDLYNMLCYSIVYCIFSTDNPFNSVGIEQHTLMDIILKRILSNGVTADTINSAIKATVGNKAGEFCIFELRDNLNNPDAKTIAIEQSKIIFEEYKSKSGGKSYTVESYTYEDRLNAITKFITLLYFDLCEYDEAIKYFNMNYRHHDKSEVFDELLDLIKACDLLDLWISIYEKAVSRKVKPSEHLVKEYNYIKKNNAFSEYYLY